MGRSCVVRNCPQNTIMKSGDTVITLHRFPKNEELKKKWEEAVNRRDGWKSTKYSYICSLHFENKCFKKSTGRVMLLSWAVPSLMLCCNDQLQPVENFAFVPIKSEEADDEMITSEARNSFVKVEEDMNDIDFIDVKFEDDTINESTAGGVDPLDVALMKQETQDGHCLADLVIEEEIELTQLKEEEVIIDDRDVLMDWRNDEEGKSNYLLEQEPNSTRVSQPICSQYKPISCDMCGMKFYDQELLENHRKNNHLRCEVCHKLFRTTYALRTHTIFHKVERQITCSKCSGNFMWVGSLQQFNMYKSGEKCYFCKTCDAIESVNHSFTTNNAQRNQKVLNKPLSAILAFTVVCNKNVEINQAPALYCDFCSYKFNTFDNMLDHRSKHTVEKELLCTYCSTVSNWVGTVEKCDKFVSGEEDFMCPSCIVYKGAKCSVCNKAVNNKRTQNNNQPFVCDSCISPKVQQLECLPSTSKNICVLCKANFDTIPKLEAHKNSHKVQCQVDCGNCKKALKYKGSLATLESCLSGFKKIVCNNCVNSQQLKNAQYVDAALTCNKCNKLVKWFGELQPVKK